MKLRKRIPVSYYEPDEPSFDEFVYCEKCADFVYEYCSIHGPLLVIPDDKIRDRNNKYSHVIDASDANASNWMRYVNCARRWPEQNLIAYQYQGQIYYRTIKIIPRFTELLVFYGSEFATVLDIDIRRFNSDLIDLKPIGITTKKHAVEYDDHSANIIKLLKYEKIKQSDAENINPCLEYEAVGTKTEEYIIIDEFEQNYNNEEKIEEDSNITVEYDLEKGSKPTDPNNMSKMVESHPSREYKKPQYVCSNCKNGFTRNHGLGRHLRICNQNVKPNKAYKCYTCGYTNSSMYYLARHYLCHPGPHQCHICNKTFALRKSFNSHMKIHISKKLYNCSKCYFKTNYLYVLSQHSTVHMQEKTYQCDMCSYSTFIRNNFVKHIRIHYK